MTPRADEIRITILVNNEANDGLRSEHGLSVWIEAPRRRFLFDTGQGPALSNNAAKLKVPLDAVTNLVLSHGHYDHTGGVSLVLEKAPEVNVYCHPEAVIPRYSIRNSSSKPIGMPRNSKQSLNGLAFDKLHWTTQPIEVAPGVGVTGAIPRLMDYEDTGGPFFADSYGKRPDLINDDLALWIRTSIGLVVIVGCSHAGLVNTLCYVQKLSGDPRIHAVLGGFHLQEASETRLERTLDALVDLDPDLIVPCHCTGDGAIDRLRETLGARVVAGSAGATYTFGP